MKNEVILFLIFTAVNKIQTNNVSGLTTYLPTHYDIRK